MPRKKKKPFLPHSLPLCPGPSALECLPEGAICKSVSCAALGREGRNEAGRATAAWALGRPAHGPRPRGSEDRRKKAKDQNRAWRSADDRGFPRPCVSSCVIALNPRQRLEGEISFSSADPRGCVSRAGERQLQGCNYRGCGCHLSPGAAGTHGPALAGCDQLCPLLRACHFTSRSLPSLSPAEDEVGGARGPQR